MGVTLRSALAEVLPTADSADNANMSDVIGNKTDTVNGNSIMGYSKSIDGTTERSDEHNHKEAKCYPSLADGVLITGGVAAWTLGNAVVLVPINTITMPFDIHYLEVEVASANDIYEIVLYSDAGTTEIGRVRTSKQSNQTGATSARFQCPVQPANTGIWAKLASKSGGNNLTLSIFYHEY